jgi:hypothetical protein
LVVPFELRTIEDVDDALKHLAQAWVVATPTTRETLARIRDRLLDTRLVLARRVGAQPVRVAAGDLLAQLARGGPAQPRTP